MAEAARLPATRTASSCGRLTQTGLVGSLLAIAGLLAALTVAARAIRGPDPLGRAVSAGALAAFAYWVVHGSFDWFWEFAGLGAAAFALLGLACSLAGSPGGTDLPPPDLPTPDPTTGEPSGEGSSRRGPLRPAALGLAVLLGLLIALSFAGPWLSQLEVQRAAKSWTSSPSTAYSQLRSASELNPLSDQAHLVAGSIALRLGQLERARRSSRRRSRGHRTAPMRRSSWE